MENVLNARRTGLLIDPLLGRSLAIRTIYRQLGRLLQRLDGRIPNLENAYVIDRPGNLIRTDEKIRAWGDIGVVRHFASICADATGK